MTHVQVRRLARILAASKRNILLLGPRQVGKSTIPKALRPARYLNLADETQFLAYAKDPGRLRREVEALPHPGLVVVDEVQRVPRLLNTRQSLMDDLRAEQARGCYGIAKLYEKRSKILGALGYCVEVLLVAPTSQSANDSRRRI